MKARLVFSFLLVTSSLGCQTSESLSLETPGESQAEAKSEDSFGCKEESKDSAAAPPDDDPNKRWPIVVGGSPSRGPDDAPVTMVVFSDFECSHCAKLVPTLREISDAYPKEVRIVFKNMPLSAKHPLSGLAAEAALAAGEQHRFWDFHDALFADQRSRDRAALNEQADALKLDRRAFEQAMDGDAAKRAVEADKAQAEKLGVVGTPTTFINGKRTVGARPLSFYRSVIDEELGKR